MIRFKRFFAALMLISALSMSVLADDGQSPIGDYAGQSPIDDRMSEGQIPCGDYASAVLTTITAIVNNITALG
jgi:hypothetical protein